MECLSSMRTRRFSRNKFVSNRTERVSTRRADLAPSFDVRQKRLFRSSNAATNARKVALLSGERGAFCMASWRLRKTHSEVGSMAGDGLPGGANDATRKWAQRHSSTFVYRAISRRQHTCEQRSMCESRRTTGRTRLCRRESCGGIASVGDGRSRASTWTPESQARRNVGRNSSSILCSPCSRKKGGCAGKSANWGSLKTRRAC